MNHRKAIKKAFNFAMDGRKIGIISAIYLGLFALIGLPLYALFKSTNLSFAFIGSVLQMESAVFVITFGAIIYLVVSILIELMIVRSYYKEVDFLESFSKIKPFYWRALAVYLVISLIGGIVGSIPFLGSILSIVVSMVFLFAVQFILIDKEKFDETIKSSWNLFKDNIADVFITWLIKSIIVGLVIVVALIPLLAGIVFLYSFSGASPTAGPATSLWLIVGGFLLILGLVVSQLFRAAYLTESFIDIRGIKKK